MMKKYQVAVLGCGSRGHCYSSGIAKRKDQYDIVALCDVSTEQIEKLHTLLNLQGTEDFCDVEQFFEKKRADLLIIATPDREHVPQAVRALKLGYDLLLEKPLSDDRAELELLERTQKETGRQVMVCHELRFGAGYRKCNELVKSGAIGKLMMIDASERPYYWHWAQAYVRGTFSKLSFSHPAILAKCSHDLDLIQWYAGSRCKTVSSIGGTRLFTEENAPEGSAERCLDCKYVDTCPYSAKRVYIERWHELGEPEFDWPFNKVSIVPPNTEKALYEGIRDGMYGQCAFRCHTEQVDHQIVQMEFENGVKANLKMAFGNPDGRRLVFFGSHGELTMDERTDEITLNIYGGKTETIKIGTIIEGGHGHGGGDDKMMSNLYGMLEGTLVSETSLDHSLEAHYIGICAEESRKQGGVLVQVHPA